MKTPLCDFVAAYVDASLLRAHMPGHKGKTFLGPEALDITEIPGADVLYFADGILRESEENAARLFDAARTLYSVEGSSLSIRAMVYLLTAYARTMGRTPRLLAPRNVHRAFLSAAALCDTPVDFLLPSGASYLFCPLTPALLEEHLAASAEPPTALFLTSPDYLGHIADIAGLAAVCHRHGVLLAVDNAHGAYLSFLPENRHPLALGADLCCDSAHKTLPALTGTGYLHLSKRAPAFFVEQAPAAMALFASTSPSYLLLQSLDRLNATLDGPFSERLAVFLPRVLALKEELVGAGYSLIGEEALKLTLAPKARGYTGQTLSACLAERGVIAEFADPDFLVLMLSPYQTSEELVALREALCALPARAKLTEVPPPLAPPQPVCSLREALFAPAVVLPPAEAVGKIAADLAAVCPPALPPVLPGERIGKEIPAFCRYYGIDRLRVMR